MNSSTASVRTLEEIKQLIFPVVSKYDVDRVYIFGSYARGEANERSDVDMRIDADKIRAFDLCGLMARLERALKTPIDVIPTDSMSKEFLDSIRNEEVMVYER
jgi:predicted nucleotidyltransferase